MSPPTPSSAERAAPSVPARANSPDVVVLGGGLIGLAAAAAIAERGARVTLVSTDHPGAASPAAAGMLAPSIEDDGAAPEVRAFANAARDRFVEYLDWLADQTGTRVSLNRAGVLQLAATEATARLLHGSLPAESRWLEPDELRREEPSLAPMAGAVLHPSDGAVDNRLLVDTLRDWCRSSPLVRWIDGTATRVNLRGPWPMVTIADGSAVHARVLVVATGAWVSTLAGLPRPIPVQPVKGQMIAVRMREAPRHVIFAPGCYLVPRGGGRLLAGATMERAGFDVRVDPEVSYRLHQSAAAAVPSVGALAIDEAWVGLRPVSPDMLPIIGRDPEHSSLIYACGHSRNGILLAPLTGDCLAALAFGERPAFDLSPFSLARFAEV